MEKIAFNRDKKFDLQLSAALGLPRPGWAAWGNETTAPDSFR